MQGSWFFGERRLLSAWAWLANGKNTKTLEKSLTDFQSRGLIAPLEVLAGDGRMLRGWRIRGISSTSAVLIAFGNLTTADYMTDRLLPLAQRIQSDIIIIDFRGYGRSVPGKGSFRALVQDEVEIGAALRGMGYSSIVGYGFSLGGIFLVNAVHGGLKLDNLIVDSIPATLTEYKCDSSVYPINVIDASCPNVTAVTSDNDVEVPPATQSPLLEHIQSPTCHGSVVHLRTAIHAFNDRPGTPGDVERVEAIVSLLSSK
jgi:pimeloyl-ACP methyl ester carboxylesterase